MNKDFQERKKLYEDLIDLGFFGSLENYSISSELPRLIYKKKEISMAEFLDGWTQFFKNKQGLLNLYIHIPYCVKKCHYCYTGSSELTEEDDLEAYVEKLCTYLDFFSDKFENEVFNNFYMGGGDPSILSEDLLNRLLEKIFSNFSFKKGGERTVENDPRNASKEKFKILKKHGINRVSMGVQSLNPEVLKVNNRLNQTVEDVCKAVNAAKKVDFKVFNVDLMVGLFGDDEKSIVKSFKKIAELGPDEISLYALQPLRGYLNRFYKTDRESFFENRRDLYQKIIPKFEKIASENSYQPPSSMSAAEDFNDADCVKYKKRGAQSMKTSYISHSFSDLQSILGIGKGAESVIANKFRATGRGKLIENPEEYLFHGRVLDEKKQLIKHVITSISARRGFRVNELTKQFNQELIQDIMETARQLEKVGMLKINETGAWLNSKKAREKLLCSLFFFPEDLIIDLIDRKNVTGEGDRSSSMEGSNLKIPKKTNPELEKRINSVLSSTKEDQIKMEEGLFIEKKKRFIKLKVKERGVKKFDLSEEAVFIRSWLDKGKGFNLISSEAIKPSILEEDDSIILKIDQNKDKVLVCEQIKVK